MSLHYELSLTRETDGVTLVAVTATNVGSADPVDTQLTHSVLVVDGEPVVAWPRIVGNGARDVRETALPSGESVTLSRRLAIDIFDPRQGAEVRLSGPDGTWASTVVDRSEAVDG